MNFLNNTMGRTIDFGLYYYLLVFVFIIFHFFFFLFKHKGCSLLPLVRYASLHLNTLSPLEWILSSQKKHEAGDVISGVILSKEMF